MNISDYVVSLLRTAVPTAWGFVIAWLLSNIAWLAGVLESISIDPNSPAAATWVTGVVIVAWYALWRKIEPSMWPWLTRIVLGSNSAPRYDEPAA